MAYQDPYSTNYNYNNAGYPQHNYDHQEQQPGSYPPYAAAGMPQAAESSSTPGLYQDESYANFEKRRTRASFGEPPKYALVLCCADNHLLTDSYRNTGELRLWRHDEHGNLWTKAS